MLLPVLKHNNVLSLFFSPYIYIYIYIHTHICLIHVCIRYSRVSKNPSLQLVDRHSYRIDMLGLCSFAAVACFSLTVYNLIVNSVRLFSPRLFLLSCPCLFLGNPMLLLLRFNIRLCRRTPFDQRYKIDVVLANLSINGDCLNLFFMPVKRADFAFRTDSSSRKKKFIPRADEKASRKDTEREKKKKRKENEHRPRLTRRFLDE